MNFEEIVDQSKDPEIKPKSIFETILNENISESVLDPVNKDLNPAIFNKERMKSSVRNAIISNFTKWWTEIGGRQSQINSIIMIGSSSGYQYSESSDIDINIQLTVDQERIDQIWDILPNGHLLDKTQHPINYYLTLEDDGIKNSDSAYDLVKDEWIKKPQKSNYKPPFDYGLEIAKFFMYGIDNKIAELERDLSEIIMYEGFRDDKEAERDVNSINAVLRVKENELKADLDALELAHHLARSFRQEAFEEGYESRFLIDIKTKNPNESLNNIIYKILEKFGYFEKINKYKDLYKKYSKTEK